MASIGITAKNTLKLFLEHYKTEIPITIYKRVKQSCCKSVYIYMLHL